MMNKFFNWVQTPIDGKKLAQLVAFSALFILILQACSDQKTPEEWANVYYKSIAKADSYMEKMNKFDKENLTSDERVRLNILSNHYNDWIHEAYYAAERCDCVLED